MEKAPYDTMNESEHKKSMWLKRQKAFLFFVLTSKSQEQSF